MTIFNIPINYLMAYIVTFIAIFLCLFLFIAWLNKRKTRIMLPASNTINSNVNQQPNPLPEELGHSPLQEYAERNLDPKQITEFPPIHYDRPITPGLPEDDFNGEPDEKRRYVSPKKRLEQALMESMIEDVQNGTLKVDPTGIKIPVTLFGQQIELPLKGVDLNKLFAESQEPKKKEESASA